MKNHAGEAAWGSSCVCSGVQRLSCRSLLWWQHSVELKGAGAAEGRVQRKTLPGVGPEREGERELLAQNSCWWISSREGSRIPCWLLPCLIVQDSFKRQVNSFDRSYFRQLSSFQRRTKALIGTKACLGGEGLSCRSSYTQRPSLPACLSLTDV